MSQARALVVPRLAIRKRICRFSQCHPTLARMVYLSLPPAIHLNGIWVNFGIHLMTDVYFCWKSECKKTEWKRYPRKVKVLETGRSQGSWTAPLKSKIFWVINNNWTGNNNKSTKKQQLQSRCSSSTVVVCVSCSISSVRLLLCLCFVRFKFQNDVVFVYCSISNSRPMIWHTLS